MFTRDILGRAPEAVGTPALRARADRDYALVIGIDHYPDFRPLTGAVADAVAFRDWLTAPSGAGIPTRNVRLLASSADPLRPLQDDVDEALLGLLSDAERGGDASRFYFFFSGHGATADEPHDVSLCLSKWSTRMRRCALSSARYCELLLRSGLFEEVIMFLDCCRALDIRALGARPYVDVTTSGRRRIESRVYMAYGTEFQRSAFEGPSVDLALGARGVFSSVLLGALNGAAAERTGVTATSLKRYLELEVPRRAATFGVAQRAEVVNGLSEACSRSFGAALPLLRAIHVRFRLDTRRLVTLSDGSGRTLRTGMPNPDWRVMAAPGLYLLWEEGTGRRRIVDHTGEREATDVEF